MQINQRSREPSNSGSRDLIAQSPDHTSLKGEDYEPLAEVAPRACG